MLISDAQMDFETSRGKSSRSRWGKRDFGFLSKPNKWNFDFRSLISILFDEESDIIILQISNFGRISVEIKGARHPFAKLFGSWAEKFNLPDYKFVDVDVIFALVLHICNILRAMAASQLENVFRGCALTSFGATPAEMSWPAYPIPFSRSILLQIKGNGIRNEIAKSARNSASNCRIWSRPIGRHQQIHPCGHHPISISSP